MRKVLHILTKPEDPLAGDIISLQGKMGAQAEVFDLTKPEPDYKALVEKVFEADSVTVW